MLKRDHRSHALSLSILLNMPISIKFLGGSGRKKKLVYLNVQNTWKMENCLELSVIMVIEFIGL